MADRRIAMRPMSDRSATALMPAMILTPKASRQRMNRLTVVVLRPRVGGRGRSGGIGGG